MDDGEPKQQPHPSASYGQDVPARSDIDEILRRKRKAREYKVRWMGGKADEKPRRRRDWT